MIPRHLNSYVSLTAHESNSTDNELDAKLIECLKYQLSDNCADFKTDGACNQVMRYMKTCEKTKPNRQPITVFTDKSPQAKRPEMIKPVEETKTEEPKTVEDKVPDDKADKVNDETKLDGSKNLGEEKARVKSNSQQKKEPSSEENKPVVPGVRSPAKDKKS